MKITKLGHCCLIIKENNLTILTDPGMFTTAQNDVTGIDVILITHEHQDHFHIDSLKKVLEHNPKAQVITNKSVGALLSKENIAFTLVADGQDIEIGGVKIEGIGTTHADIYKAVTPVENTGYFIGNKLFYPGDAFTDPERPVDILALPVTAPWLKISEVIEYALKLKPQHAFPVHDGFINPQLGAMAYRMPERFLTEAGISFHKMLAGDEIEL